MGQKRLGRVILGINDMAGQGNTRRQQHGSACRQCTSSTGRCSGGCRTCCTRRTGRRCSAGWPRQVRVQRHWCAPGQHNDLLFHVDCWPRGQKEAPPNGEPSLHSTTTGTATRCARAARPRGGGDKGSRLVKACLRGHASDAGGDPPQARVSGAGPL